VQAVHYSEPTAVYECAYDKEAHIKLFKHLGKREWKQNFVIALKAGVQWCVYFVPLTFFVAWFSKEEGIAVGMFVSVGLAMLGGFLHFYIARDDFVKHGDRSSVGTKWTCWFTDEAYWMRDEEGFVTGMP
jgi:hypothetical protein